MIEEIPSIGSEVTPREFTPQEKLLTLVSDYEKFAKEPYASMDPAAVQHLRQNVLNLMDELRKDHPELNQ